MTDRHFTTFQLFLIAMFAVLVVVAKIALRLPLQLSGHSGVFWMAILITASRIVPRAGALSLIGITSGAIAAFLGMGDLGALNTFFSYSAVGIGTEAALVILRNPENRFFAVLAGILGHLCKFLVKWFFGIISGAPIGFVALGLAKAVAGYIIFGALGGLLGSVTISALKKAGFFAYMEEKK